MTTLSNQAELVAQHIHIGSTVFQQNTGAWNDKSFCSICTTSSDIREKKQDIAGSIICDSKSAVSSALSDWNPSLRECF